MLSPRTRRLKLDYETLVTRFANWPIIMLTGTAGMPPEVYRITYHIKGLFVTPNGEILERDVHQLEINLSLGYPRRAPQCRMLAPVFHPNFDDASVCIGDFWAASEGLDDLIVRIGRMIAYQEYNTKSPLNGLAAKWAAQHASLLPVDSRNIAPPTREEAAHQVPPADPSESQEVTTPAPNVSAPQATSSNDEQAAPPVSAPADREQPSSDPWTERIVID